MKTNRKVLLLVLVLIFSAPSYSLFAQENEEKAETTSPQEKEYKTLLSGDDGNVNHGGYIALTLAYTAIENDPAIQLGGRIAWVINHKFALGFTGSGFFNNLDKSNTSVSSDYFIAGGYGGLFFQPILFPKSPIHVSFPITLGVGGVTVNKWSDWEQHHWDDNYDKEYTEKYYYDSDVFLVFEPGIDVEFNMLKFLRMSVGASYRFTNPVNLQYHYNKNDAYYTHKIDPNALNNFTVRMGFLFGWF